MVDAMIIAMVSDHIIGQRTHGQSMVNAMLTLFSVMVIYVDGQEYDYGQCNDGH